MLLVPALRDLANKHVHICKDTVVTALEKGWACVGSSTKFNLSLVSELSREEGKE